MLHVAAHPDDFFVHVGPRGEPHDLLRERGGIAGQVRGQIGHALPEPVHERALSRVRQRLQLVHHPGNRGEPHVQIRFQEPALRFAHDDQRAQGVLQRGRHQRGDRRGHAGCAGVHLRRGSRSPAEYAARLKR